MKGGCDGKGFEDCERVEEIWREGCEMVVVERLTMMGLNERNGREDVMGSVWRTVRELKRFGWRDVREFESRY